MVCGREIIDTNFVGEDECVCIEFEQEIEQGVWKSFSVQWVISGKISINYAVARQRTSARHGRLPVHSSAETITSQHIGQPIYFDAHEFQ